MRFSKSVATIVAWQLVLVHASAAKRDLAPAAPGGQTQPCTLVQLEVQFKDGSSKSKWQCELSTADTTTAGQRFVDVEGLTEDDLKKTRSGTTSLFSKGASFSNGKLVFAAGAKKEFGKVERNSPAASVIRGNGANGAAGRRLTEGVVDTHKVLAVRVAALDVSPNSTLIQIRNFIFGTSGDVSNLRERYRSCSYGETLMEPFNGATATGRSVFQGAVPLPISVNAKNELDFVLVDESLHRLTALYGDLESQFDHIMLCLPPGTTSDGNAGWIAWAYIDHWLSVYNNDACNYPVVQVHEIGHNLGLAHSNEGIEYGDWTCMMGNPGYGNDTLRMCFNVAKSYQLGWYSLRTITLDFTQRTGFNGQLLGINNYKHVSADGKYVIVRVLGSSYYQPDVFVGWNLASGINIDVQEAKNFVTVYTKWGGVDSPSELVSRLSVLRNYTWKNFDYDDHDLIIKYKSMSAVATPPYAEVDVYMSGCLPGTFSPSCNSCMDTPDCPDADPCTVKSCVANSCSYDTSNCVGNFTLHLDTDGWPTEVSWEVFDQCQEQVVLKGDSYKSWSPMSLASSGILGQSMYTFTMRDSYGDGMYDGWDVGGFHATFDGARVSATTGDFRYEFSNEFGTPCVPMA